MIKEPKTCIINAALGSWYPRGQERLKRSLIHHGFAHDILTWRDWPNSHFRLYGDGAVYNVKAAAFEQAIKLGYTNILWLDCSVWAIQNPDRIFEIIEEEGGYFWPNGFNCAQECSDKCLDYFGLNRNEAEAIPCVSSSMVGVNMQHQAASAFVHDWIQSAKDGQFLGSREHNGQSKDPRFLHHRQDQSCASILAHRYGFKMYAQDLYSAYYQPQLPDSVIFTMQGL